MCTPRGMGYLTRLDSSAYSNETRDRGVLLDTTSKGMPIGPPSQVPEPKSACTGAFKPIEAISWAEFAATGSLSTRWFHGLFAGKTGQRGAAGSRSARAVEPASSASARTATRTRRLNSLLIDLEVRFLNGDRGIASANLVDERRQALGDL